MADGSQETAAPVTHCYTSNGSNSTEISDAVFTSIALQNDPWFQQPSHAENSTISSDPLQTSKPPGRCVEYSPGEFYFESATPTTYEQTALTVISQQEAGLPVNTDNSILPKCPVVLTLPKASIETVSYVTTNSEIPLSGIPQLSTPQETTQVSAQSVSLEEFELPGRPLTYKQLDSFEDEEPGLPGRPEISMLPTESGVSQSMMDNLKETASLTSCGHISLPARPEESAPPSTAMFEKTCSPAPAQMPKESAPPFYTMFEKPVLPDTTQVPTLQGLIPPAVPKYPAPPSYTMFEKLVFPTTTQGLMPPPMPKDSTLPSYAMFEKPALPATTQVPRLQGLMPPAIPNYLAPPSYTMFEKLVLPATTHGLTPPVVPKESAPPSSAISEETIPFAAIQAPAPQCLIQPARPQELKPPPMLDSLADIPSLESNFEHQYDIIKEPDLPVTLRPLRPRQNLERTVSQMEGNEKTRILLRHTQSVKTTTFDMWTPSYMKLHGSESRMSNPYDNSAFRHKPFKSLDLTEAGESAGISNAKTNKLGWLHKMGKSKKDWTKSWCVANEKSLDVSGDKNKTPAFHLLSNSILSIVILQKTFTYNHSILYCFDILVKGSNNEKARIHTFGASNVVERHEWMSSIWELITPARNVAMSMVSAITKAGRFQYKETVTGIWQPVWLALSDRKLTLWPEGEIKPIEIDIRKVKSLNQQKDSSKFGASFNVNYSGNAIYLSSVESSETEDTFKMVMTAWNAIGYELQDQLLTQDDIPVIIDMCTKHIFIHGLQVKDIYKGNATTAELTPKIESLINQLRKDPFQVKLSPDQYTSDDVAKALKGFLQKLANPLLTNELGQGWKEVNDATEDKRRRLVCDLVSKLPEIHFKTLKYLLVHLRNVIQCQNQNGMSERDIVNAFGPIFIGESLNEDSEYVGRTVLTCMLRCFEELFDVDETELQMERDMLKLALQPKVELMNTSKTRISNAGILISIYVDNRDIGECVPFTLLPKMTANDVCIEVLKRLKRSVQAGTFILCEVVCGGSLARPVHFADLVLEVTMRWMNWVDKEAGQNYLLLKQDDIYCKLLPLLPHLKDHKTIPLKSEVYLAKAKSKTFKKVILKFQHTQLSYFKDKKKSEPEGFWNIEDVVWYIGHESLRTAPTKFAITFFERSASVERTKSRPYIGSTVCMNTETDWYTWMAVMLTGEHPKGLLPT